MNELIKREDAIRALLELSIIDCINKHDAVGKCVATIIGLPSADRPSGEWIPATWNDAQAPVRLRTHKCSVCGKKAERILVRTELIDNYYCNKCEPITEYTHQEQLSDFCPHCGARMKDVTEGLESRTDLIWYGDKTDLIRDETGRHTGWFGKGADDE